MRTSRVRNLSLVFLLLVTLVGLGTYFYPAIRYWREFEEKYWRAGDHVGIYAIHRESQRNIGSRAVWNTDTGRLVEDRRFLSDSTWRATHWRVDGSVWFQESRPNRNGERLNDGPDWWWPVRSQREPSAPWIQAGMPLDDWWALVSEEVD